VHTASLVGIPEFTRARNEFLVEDSPIREAGGAGVGQEAKTVA